MAQHLKIKYVLHHIKKLKKHHIIISRDAEKASGKIQHLVVKKRNPQQPRNREELPQFDKEYSSKIL